MGKDFQRNITVEWGIVRSEQGLGERPIITTPFAKITPEGRRVIDPRTRFLAGYIQDQAVEGSTFIISMEGKTDKIRFTSGIFPFALDLNAEKDN